MRWIGVVGLALGLAGMALAKDKLPAPPQPFGFVLGSTSEADARQLCTRENAGATARGLVDTRPAPDAAPDPVPNPRAVLLDVAGLPMEGLASTRLAFLDDRLYAIAYRFAEGFDGARLLPQLEAKYGKPDVQQGLSRRYEWRFEGASLVLVDDVRGPDSMVFLHAALYRAQLESSQQAWKAWLDRKAGSERGF